MLPNLLSMLGQLPGSNVSQIYSIAFALSLVVMATCILMISSSLNSNVSQRTEFFGLMRCLGATRRQVLRFVRREALHWCVTSIPIGIGLMFFVLISETARRKESVTITCRDNTDLSAIQHRQELADEDVGRSVLFNCLGLVGCVIEHYGVEAFCDLVHISLHQYTRMKHKAHYIIEAELKANMLYLKGWSVGTVAATSAELHGISMDENR